MKKIFTTIVCISLSGIALGQLRGIWKQKNDMGYPKPDGPEGRNAAASFSIGTKGYVGTGTELNDFWEYDPLTNVWTQKANFPGPPRYGAVGFSINTKGFIGTGSWDTAPYLYNDFWEYNPSTNAWKRKADFLGSARYLAVGFSIADKGYIGTGSGSYTNPYLQDFWEYNPSTDIWERKANFGGSGRYGAAGFAIGNKGYIGTGSVFASLTNDFWEYDPDKNIWKQKANFPGSARYNAVGLKINNKGYIGTGVGNEAPYSYNDFWEYNPSTNAWKPKAKFGGMSRRFAVGFAIGGKGYVGTGSSYLGLCNDFWEYSLLRDTWRKIATLGSSTRAEAVGFSIGSKSYVGTGYDATGYKKDLWEYDASTNAWTQKADFGGTARTLAVGFAIDSRGYIGMGMTFEISTVTTKFYTDFWEYNPSTNSWKQKAGFKGPPRRSAVGFSIGSRGYVGTGGILKGFENIFYNDFWEYNPSTNSWRRKADFAGSARDQAVGFSIRNKGYIGTGRDAVLHYPRDFWEYEASTDTWTRKSDFPGKGRYRAVGFSISSYGFIGTGASYIYQQGEWWDIYFNDFWRYNQGNNSWTRVPDFKGTPRNSAVGFSIGKNGYVGTGYDGGVQKADFWEFTSITCTAPITLSGAQVRTDVYLNWQKTQEQNPAYFVIERSANGIHFDSINRVNVTEIAITDTYYSYYDKSVDKLRASTLYYRLKEVYNDGEKNLSNSFLIKVSPANSNISVFPNPAKKILNLLFKESLGEKAYFNLYDITGKIVLHRQLSQYLHQQYFLTNINSGNYRIVIWNGEKKVHEESLIIYR